MSRNFSMNILSPTLKAEDWEYFRYLWVHHDLRAVQLINGGHLMHQLYEDKMAAGQYDFRIVFRSYPDNNPQEIESRGGMVAVLERMKWEIDSWQIPYQYIVFQPVNEWGHNLEHWKMLEQMLDWASSNNCIVGTGAWGTGGWDLNTMNAEEQQACIDFYTRAAKLGKVIDTCHEYAAQRDIRFTGMYRGQEVNYNPFEGQLWQSGRFILRGRQLQERGVETLLPTMVLESFYDDLQTSSMKGYDLDLLTAGSSRVPAEKMITDLNDLMYLLYDPAESSPYYDEVREWNPDGVPVLWFSYGNGGMGTYGSGDWRQFNLAGDWGSLHSRPRYEDFFNQLETWYTTYNVEEPMMPVIPVPSEEYRKTVKVRPLYDYTNIRNQPYVDKEEYLGKFTGEWEVPYYEKAYLEGGYAWYYFDLSVVGMPSGWMASEYLVIEDTGSVPTDIDSIIIELTQVQNEIARMQISLSENAGQLANLYEKVGRIIEGLG